MTICNPNKVPYFDIKFWIVQLKKKHVIENVMEMLGNNIVSICKIKSLNKSYDKKERKKDWVKSS